MKVLIVEDSAPMVKMIRRTISEWANEICECADGAAAFRLYSEQFPDWVLMDIDLGETDGIAATREIVRRHPQAKIVMVTNYDDDGLRQAASEAGARGYVLKDDLFGLRSYLQ